MLYSNQQKRRLVGVLEQIQLFENDDPIAKAEYQRRISRFTTDFATMGFGSQEHNDIITLHNSGFIRHRTSPFHDPETSTSNIGIYEYRLTSDGREFLIEELRTMQQDPSDNPLAPAQESPTAFIIHGTDPRNFVDKVIETCTLIGITPQRMADQPHAGRTLPQKLHDTMSTADCYIAVLTADEQQVDGSWRPRPNATAEVVGLVIHGRNDRLIILKEESADISSTSNLQGMAYITMAGAWRIKLADELKHMGMI